MTRERGDSERPRGRFWVLESLADDEPASSESETEGAESPPATAATFGDALACARDLRGAPKPRKGKADRFRILEERLKRSKAAATTASTSDLPQFRYVQVTPSSRRRSPASPVISVSDSEDTDWFRVVGGKAVRLGSSPDSDSATLRRAGRTASWASEGSPPALFPSRSPIRPLREAGDDVTISAGVFVSIRTLGRGGPRGMATGRGTHADRNVRMENSTRALSPSREAPARIHHLDALFSHLWISPVRVPSKNSPAAECGGVEVMGDNYGNHGGGGGNWRGGGYGYNNFQPYNYNQYRPHPPHPRPPPPRSQENVQYKRKEPVLTNNPTQPGSQNQGQNQNMPQITGGVQPGGANSSTAASSSAAGPVSHAAPDSSKAFCLKCREKGHVAKSCSVKVECINCGKTSHQSEMCTWLKQKKPIAAFVGYGAPGLGCFVADHMKEAGKEDKGRAVALIKVVEGPSLNVSADRLKHGLIKTYPWKWEWKVSKLADGMFLVDFPSLARINEAAIYDCVPLRGSNMMINVTQWEDGMHAAGKLTTAWVQARGIPKPLLHYQGICQAGSTIGHVLEVDMQSVKDFKLVRIKMGLVNHHLLPVTTRVTTPDLFYYNVRFKLDEVIEEGWIEDEELLATLEEMENKRLDEIEAREAKRRKSEECGSSNVGNTAGNGGVTASEGTKQALIQRELQQQQQDCVDADILRQKIDSNKSNNANGDPMELGEKFVVFPSTDTDEEAEKVRLSDDDTGEDEFTDSQVNLSVGVGDGTSEAGSDDDLIGEETLRCSGRLAKKNTEDIPVLDRAKTLAAARNLDPSQGNGGRKGGAAAGRKAAGKGR